VIVAAAALHVYAVDYVADDGFISFRYADHLARGYGFVYNIGERVEGYTNFLWVILLAAAKWSVPSIEIQQVARLAGTLASLLTVVLAFRLSSVVGKESAVGSLAGAFLASHSSLAAWSAAGLETALFALLVFAGAASFVSYLKTGTHLVLAAVLLALAALARPDGVLLFMATLAALGITDVRRGRLAPAIKFIAVFTAIYLPYFLWRYVYYGDPFPNTAYAKVGFGLWQLTRGARYLWTYIVEYGVLVWILPVLLYLRRSREMWSWYLTWMIAVYISYIIYIGGDGLAFHRFIAHIAPLMYFLAANALVDLYRRDLAPRLRSGVAMAGATLGVIILLAVTSRSTLVPILLPDRARWFEPQSELWFPGNGHGHSYVWFDNYFVDRLTVAARYLEHNAPRNSLVASTPAGAIGYHMHHSVIDMLGLTDKHIARAPDAPEDLRRYRRAGHEKGDGAYVLSRAPDYILMGNVAVFPYPLDEKSMAKKLVLKSEHELWDSAEFHQRYELVSLRLSDEGLFQYFTFFRKKR
jgi:arabinofuranosyltransferase